MKQKIKTFSISITIAMVLFSAGCTKEKGGTLNALYTTYKKGQIDECKYNGETVYVAGQNVYDGGSVVYNKAGKEIGTCNYGWGQVDEICTRLESCKVIYRCENHISGEPFVDTYGLSE
jgi:hypothetical protein